MIFLAQPPREPPATRGACRYNAELGRRFAATGDGRVVDVPAEELAGRARELVASRPDAVVVFDSRYLDEIGAPPWLHELPAMGETRLLVHALASADPSRTAEKSTRLQIERAWFAAVDAVIATTERCGLVAEHEVITHVVPPGVADCFHPAPAVRTGRAARTVVSVGAVVPEKAQLELVRAVAEAAIGHGDCRLLLVGDHDVDPAYTAAVREAANGLELELAGWLPSEEVARRLHGADLYVSAERHSPYGLAMAEAVAAGLPVVAYRTGEVDSWVRDGENGHLFDAADTRGWGDCLRTLLANPAALGDLRTSVRAPRFDNWDEAYKSFVSACRSTSAARAQTPEVTLHSSCELPTEFGAFDIGVYRVDGQEHAVVASMGDLSGPPAFVRVHSECFTGEVLRSLKCDCDGQLRAALREISDRGRGAVIYLRQEGRGIGLGNKILAYREQAKGSDTIEANRVLGFPADLRDFTAAALILAEHGAERVELATNNPLKVRALRENGIAVERVLPSVQEPNPHNEGYLRAKWESLGHVGLQHALPSSLRTQLNGTTPGRTLLVFDLDGVIQFGEEVPDDAVQLVEQLRKAGYALRFLSNDGFNSRDSRMRQLARAGLSVAREELYTASFLAARYLEPRAPILVLGGPPGSDELAHIPQSAAAPQTVVVGDWFGHYDREQLQAAFDALERGAELVALHRKPHWSRNGRRLVDVGFWVAGLEYSAKRRATVVGKPSEFAYRTVLADAGYAPHEAVMISDEVDPDLIGASRQGLHTVLLSSASSGAAPGEDTNGRPYRGRTIESHAALWDALKPS